MIPHHIVNGVGKPLVLANSLGANLHMWDGQADALAEHFTLIRFDARGHGESEVPPGPYAIEDYGRDVLDLLDHLRLESAHIAGISLGGMTAMWLAINAPERVDRIIPTCTSAKLGPPQMWIDRANAVREGGVEAIAPAVAKNWVTDPALRPELEKMIAATPRDGYIAACAAIEHMDLLPDLHTITAPTLVISASEDPSTPPEHGQAIAERIPNARFQVLDGAAHLANLERGDELVRLYVEHLTSDRYERGMEVRRAVLGDEHVDHATANATDFTRPFQEFITRGAWGDVWTRPGLDRRTRSVITLSVLIALRAENEIGMHIRGALRNGLTPEEIRELIIHASVYAGVPAANSAMAIAAQFLND